MVANGCCVGTIRHHLQLLLRNGNSDSDSYSDMCHAVLILIMRRRFVFGTKLPLC